MAKKYLVKINEKYCKGCYLCILSCPKGIIKKSKEIGPNGYVPVESINDDECLGCNNCVTVCPDAAIEIKENKNVKKDRVRKK